MTEKERQDLINLIIGTLVGKDKYKFANKDLMAEVIRDAFKLINFEKIGEVRTDEIPKEK